MTDRQLREWEAFYRREPWTADSVEETMARGFAVVARMIAQVGGEKNPSHKPEMFRPVSAPKKKSDEGQIIIVGGRQHRLTDA